ncbi:MAG: lipoyl(octanoyl) transferase LipB [Proteobacteria bacterium]|nr:lipoyl(octanoyl) transferase LipB [Pseudomonadota bacterium]
MNIIDLGKMRYKRVWELQKCILKKVQNGEIDNTLIFVEHYDVFTFGRRGKTDTLRVKEEILRKLGFDMYVIERGGDVTYHGPGQLVIYPIYDIKSHLVGVKKFVLNMERAIINTLKEFDIESEGDDKVIGVWIGNDKIAAIGMAFDRHVSFHGAALNVNTDLNKFNYIVPCGLVDKGVTSMKKITGKEIPLDRVRDVFIEKWKEIFNESEGKLINIGEICLENRNG